MKRIEVRCKGIIIDKYGNKRPCNRRFFIGAPGFDIYGKPKILELKCPKCGAINILKCPKCGAINIITTEIEEKLIITLKEG